MSLNINIQKVDERVVDRYLSQFEIKANGKLNAKVNALEKYQRETTPDADQSLPCTECGGVSDVNLPECPYCGTVDTDIPTKESVAAATTATETAPASSPSEATSGASVLEAATQAGLAAVEAEAVKDKTQKLVKSKANKPKPNGKAHTAIVESSTGELAASKDLDDAVVRVTAALKSGAKSYWDLGQALLEIFSKQLWKQRIEGGRQKFPSWNLFCRDELGMSHVNTFQIMDVASAFSREDFEQVGHTKLRLLLPLSKERQQQLTAAAKERNLSVAELKEIVDSEKPSTPRDTGRGKGTAKAIAAAAEKKREKAATRKVVARPDGEITAVSQLGRTKVKMFARPKKGGGKPVRAVSITQDPWGEEELVNGVVVRYTLVKGPAGIELVIERKRAE